jgi:hypothetical protein
MVIRKYKKHGIENYFNLKYELVHINICWPWLNIPGQLKILDSDKKNHLPVHAFNFDVINLRIFIKRL